MRMLKIVGLLLLISGISVLLVLCKEHVYPAYWHLLHSSTVLWEGIEIPVPYPMIARRVSDKSEGDSIQVFEKMKNKKISISFFEFKKDSVTIGEKDLSERYARAGIHLTDAQEIGLKGNRFTIIKGNRISEPDVHIIDAYPNGKSIRISFSGPSSAVEIYRDYLSTIKFVR